LKDIIETAHKDFLVKGNDKLNIYTMNEYGYTWTKVGVKEPRPINTVILD